jgi:hypothetical protein
MFPVEGYVQSTHGVWDLSPPALLLILHVTAIRGVFPHKKGLEDRLNLLRKDRTLPRV